MIGIVDYGLGNVKAFVNIYKRLNLPVRSVRNAAEFDGTDRLILPGVGAFDHAMETLDASGMQEALKHSVLEKGTPILGVCVGMQMMAQSSEEGSRAGLGWIPGTVRKFPAAQNSQWRLPHMGWNNVKPRAETELFAEIDEDSRFYFLHSYFFEAHDSKDEMSHTDYFGGFTSAVNRGVVYGVQFHPEKSHSWGVQLLKNFAEFSA